MITVNLREEIDSSGRVRRNREEVVLDEAEDPDAGLRRWCETLFTGRPATSPAQAADFARSLFGRMRR
jgi:hypothetical protein